MRAHLSRPATLVCGCCSLLVSTLLLGCRPQAAEPPPTGAASAPARAVSDAASTSEPPIAPPPTEAATAVPTDAPAKMPPVVLADEPGSAQASSPADTASQTSTDGVPTSVAPRASGAAPDGTLELPDAVPRERVLLLAPGGPLVIDLELTIDDRPYDALMPELVADVLEQADADASGQVSWDELLDHPEIRYGEFGNLTPQDVAERQRLVQMYDADRDGDADRDELPRFLTRNSGEARAFSLRSSNYYRHANRSASPTLRALDRDGNGRLAAEEIAAAGSELKRYDRNDNDIVQLFDLLAPTDDNPDPLSQRRGDQADTALAVSQVRDWSVVLYSLEETYALGQPLAAANFATDPDLFAQLDTDRDGTISVHETEQLATIDPHAVVSARFGSSPTSELAGTGPAAQGQLQLVALGQQARLASSDVRAFADRLVFALPDTQLVIAIRDEAGQRNSTDEAAAVVARFDGDTNGYLEEDELPAFLVMQYGSFARVDGDGDGKLYAAELASAVDRRLRVQRSQIRARAGDDRDGLFTALDQDHDGRLAARELEQVSDHLTSLDTNGDGHVDPGEIPSSMLLVLGRGDPQAGERLFSLPPLPTIVPASAPGWFTAMDHNQDGEVSRREFLGTREQFTASDRDQDGFLTVEEVSAEQPAEPAPHEAEGS